jgi:8-oxo-dGTP pyrophosphatase MutT (NUDIX family)
MISYTEDKSKFNYRVAGLAIHEGKILLHQYEGFDFWALPGGRGEMGESSEDTIQREFYEELGEYVDIQRLLYIFESFYNHRDYHVHELCFYYLIDFQEDSEILNRTEAFEVKEIDGSILTFKWFDLVEVPFVEMYPVFIKENILDLPETIKHIIDVEEILDEII